VAIFDSLRRVFRKTVTLRHPRAHPRVMISEPIRVRTEWSHEQQAILEDISVGGACVRTHVRMKPGDTVGLLMSLGVGRRFDARARVVYALSKSTGYQTRYGVRFIGLPEREQTEINHYIVEQKFGRQFGMRPMQASMERADTTNY
jgi:c-di-GMP-binding flagellar brake protein YcgR